MGIYFEALILYIVLFFANSMMAIGNLPREATDFSASLEFYRIVLFAVPSLALLWYIIFKGGKQKNAPVKPYKNDIVSGLIALPCLLLVGFTTAIIPKYFGSSPVSLPASLPVAIIDWIALSCSCLFYAYLEESFFRYYLLSKRKEMKMGQVQALVFSVLLFSVCHIYEGPWGFLNAVISGTVLAFLYLRHQALHGIAIAHALYNITAYAANAFITRGFLF